MKPRKWQVIVFSKIAVTMKQTCDVKDLTTPHQLRLVVVLKVK